MARRLSIAIAIAVIVAGVAIWLFSRRPRATTERSPARDIILVTIDTARADAFGYSGNARVKTPFLDSLAASGVVFTNAHAHNVVTLPSHVNILTGLYPFQHGVHENAGFTLDPKHATVATLLRSAGYSTAAFVGAFPLDARFGLNQGFDLYDDNYGKGQATVDFVVQERRAGPLLASATTWWRENEGRKRFMWVHLYDPHAPYSPPEPYLSEFRGAEYLGEVSYVDDELSKALTPVLSSSPDALVIVTADHGESLGEHGERTHGLFAYEATLKVPLVVSRRGVAHRVVPEHARHIDIVPTILDAASVVATRELPGRSLLGELPPADSYFESLSASLNRGWAPLTGIIHGGQKYIDLPIAELYDLPRDPGEKTNLRDERRRDVEEARKILASMKASSAPSSRNVSAEEIARLRSLGYITGSGGERDHYSVEDDPKTLVVLDEKMHDAVDTFQRGHPKRALDLIREVIAQRPSMIAGREMYAFMLQQNNLVGEAIEQLKIIVRDPRANEANRVQLALLYCETSQPRAAVDLLAPYASTRNPDMLNAYGVALSDDGQVARARQQFELVLSYDPNNAPALQNLGILALRQGALPAAKSYLDRALALNPKLPLALNTLGVLHARTNDFGRAVEAWNRAVEIDPGQYDALYNIGLVERSAGHKEEARRALTRFVETAPKSQYAADIVVARRALAELR